MKKLIISAALLLSACASGWTETKTITTVTTIADDAKCVADNFDKPWPVVVVKCAFRPENLAFLESLWAAQRATASRSGATFGGGDAGPQ